LSRFLWVFVPLMTLYPRLQWCGCESLQVHYLRCLTSWSRTMAAI
jgi:hypothetical protein